MSKVCIKNLDIIDIEHVFSVELLFIFTNDAK